MFDTGKKLTGIINVPGSVTGGSEFMMRRSTWMMINQTERSFSAFTQCAQADVYMPTFQHPQFTIGGYHAAEELRQKLPVAPSWFGNMLLRRKNTFRRGFQITQDLYPRILAFERSPEYALARQMIEEHPDFLPSELLWESKPWCTTTGMAHESNSTPSRVRDSENHPNRYALWVWALCNATVRVYMLHSDVARYVVVPTLNVYAFGAPPQGDAAPLSRTRRSVWTSDPDHVLKAKYPQLRLMTQYTSMQVTSSHEKAMILANRMATHGAATERHYVSDDNQFDERFFTLGTSQNPRYCSNHSVYLSAEEEWEPFHLLDRTKIQHIDHLFRIPRFAPRYPDASQGDLLPPEDSFDEITGLSA